MDILLYFILRRIFVRMEFTPERICVSKGLILRRRFEIPLTAITKIETRRTPLLRLLHAKRVDITAFNGGVRIYLRRDERLPFVPDYVGAGVGAAALQSVLGAFADTRALGGVITFVLLLNRISAVFGSESFNRLMTVFLGAAEEVAKTFALLRIAVPRAAAFAGVFIAAAWTTVFLKKAAGFMRFRLSCERGFITVRRGIFTLYECRLVRNNITEFVRCDTAATLLFRAAPLYVHKVMIHPAANRLTAQRISAKLCEIPLPQFKRKPTFSLVFRHCKAPLAQLGVFLLALTAVHTDLLRSLLWCGAAISAWYVSVYAAYALRSGISYADGTAGFASRKAARLYTAAVPAACIAALSIKGVAFRFKSSAERRSN